MGIAILCIFGTLGIMLLPSYLHFPRSSYRQKSGNSFFKTVLDTGNYGEFLTFVALEKLEGHKRLMTNLYVPKEDGTTTEIDLVMIAETGFYVIESKNFSGWIYGDDKQRNWTQTFGRGKKFKFYNPVWQNEGHISALKTATGIPDDDLYNSYIVFSERCTLKKVTCRRPHVKVMKRNDLLKSVKRDMAGSSKRLVPAQVDEIYNRLQGFTLADERTKGEHIESVKAKKAR